MKHSRLIRTTALLAYVVPTIAPTFAAESAAPAARVAATLAGPAIGNGPARLDIAQPAASSAPVVGDLTHLVFTATSGLTALLVSPQPNAAATGSTAIVEVATVAGAGVELRVGDTVVPFSHIGKRTVAVKSGETHYWYYGVPLEAGPNTIALTPLGARGLRGATNRTTIFGAGVAAKLDAYVGGKPVADGHTPLFLHVHGTDRWQHTAVAGSMIRLTIVGGDAHFVGRRGANGANATPPPSAAAALGATGTVATATLASGGTMSTAATQPGVATTAAATTGLPLAVTPASVAGAAMNAPGDVLPLDTTNPVGPNPVSTLPPLPQGVGQDAAGNPDRGNVPQEAGENYRATGDLVSPSQTIDVPLLDGGDALVPIVPGLRPGEVLVRVSDGETTTDERFFLAPYIRPPMVLGLLTLGTGSVPGIPGEVDTATNAADSRRARGALFATGAIGTNTLATLAYNTADTLDENTTNGSFVDDPANRPYQLYGDASDHRVDALSRDHLYARVDSGRSSALWGDFVAQTGGPDGIGGFSLLVHGAEATLASSNVRLTGFQARNDVAYGRQIFSPTGLATTSTLLHSDIIVGSDTISLVSLDRRTGGVLAQNVLTRNVDYVLDNVTGQLRFINVPLPYDENFNPQQLVITYEYGGVTTNAETSGGRADITVGRTKAVKIGIGYVNDAYGSGNYSLFTQDVGGLLPAGFWTIGHATSKGNMEVANDLFNQSVGDGGDAYRLAFAIGNGQSHVTGGFDATTAGYDNPFGGISSPGLLEYRLGYTRKLGSNGSDVTLSYDHEQNSTLGYDNSDSNASLRLNERVSKRFGLRAGVDYRESASSITTAQTLATTLGPDQPAPIPNTLQQLSAGNQSTVQGELGFDYHPTDRLKLAVTRLADLSGGGDLSQPQQTSAELGYDFKGKGRAYVRELWSSQAQQSFAASTASLTTGAEATRSTAFGFEKSVGTNTTVDSEYVVDNGGNGGDVYSSIGVKERFAFGKNLAGDSFYQHANAIGTGLSGFNLYGVEAGYNLQNAMKVTASYQVRTGDGSGSSLSLGAIGALGPELSLIGSIHDSNTLGLRNGDANFGLAFRPYNNDRSVSLVSYNDTTGDVTALGSQAQVLSAEELFRPTWHLELAGRFAYKLDGDSYYAAHSELFGLRATQRIGNRFDVGAETRHLAVADIAGAAVNAFALEGGYRLGDQMRLGFGYNFTGSPDPSLAAAPTRRGIYGTATSTVDNIFGWGKNH